MAFVRVAVQGCAHGELDKIYTAIEEANARVMDGRRVDLLICCGDFQSTRNEADLECMACPVKYRSMQSFWKYYAGHRPVPVPTIFIGGNHEASNHLGELPYGGWVAPGIFFLGTSGVVQFGGLRIGGVSGIFKRYDFHTGFHERAPFDDDAMHSVNHQREFDFWKLAHLARPGGGPCLDVFLTHDWPEGVYRHGDATRLGRAKPHFKEDMARSALGSPPAMDAVRSLRPRFAFAGHLHCKFAALVPHGATAEGGEAAGAAGAGSGGGSGAGSCGASSSPGSDCATRFLALDKPLPGRDFLQVLDLPVRVGAPGAGDMRLCWDGEWLAVLSKAHAVLPTTKRYGRLPPPLPPTQGEVEAVLAKLERAGWHAEAAEGTAGAAGSGAGADASAAAVWPPRVPIPLNFAVTAPPYSPAPGAAGSSGAPRRVPMPSQGPNPQMDAMLAALGLTHRTTVPTPGMGVPGAAGSTDHAGGGGAGAGGAGTGSRAGSRWGEGSGGAGGTGGGGGGGAPSSTALSLAVAPPAAPTSDPAEIDLGDL